MAVIELKNREDIPGDKFQCRMEGKWHEQIELLVSGLRKVGDFKKAVSLAIMVADPDLVYQMPYMLNDPHIANQIKEIRDGMGPLKK